MHWVSIVHASIFDRPGIDFQLSCLGSGYGAARTELLRKDVDSSGAGMHSSNLQEFLGNRYDSPSEQIFGNMFVAIPQNSMLDLAFLTRIRDEDRSPI
jgi:hypothetical protein